MVQKHPRGDAFFFEFKKPYFLAISQIWLEMQLLVKHIGIASERNCENCFTPKRELRKLNPYQVQLFIFMLIPKGSFESRARMGPITFTCIIIRKELQMHIPRRSNCFSISWYLLYVYNLIYPQSLIRFFIKLEIKWRISNVTFILNPAFRMYCGQSIN